MLRHVALYKNLFFISPNMMIISLPLFLPLIFSLELVAVLWVNLGLVYDVIVAAFISISLVTRELTLPITTLAVTELLSLYLHPTICSWYIFLLVEVFSSFAITIAVGTFSRVRLCFIVLIIMITLASLI